MLKRRNKNSETPNDRSSAEPLRREAERGWEESDRSAAKGIQRRNSKARAHKLRRQSSRAKDDLIARLKQRVARLEEELAKHLKRRQHGPASRQEHANHTAP